MNFNTVDTAPNVADEINYNAFLNMTAAQRGSSASAVDTSDARTNDAVDINVQNQLGDGDLSGVTIDLNQIIKADLSAVFTDLESDATDLPENFEAITASQVENALETIQPTVDTVNTDTIDNDSQFEGSQFVFSIGQDQEIELAGNTDTAELGTPISDVTKEIVFSAEIDSYDSDAGEFSYSLNKEGILDFGKMFSGIGDMPDSAFSGTSQAATKEAEIRQKLADLGVLGQIYTLSDLDGGSGSLPNAFRIEDSVANIDDVSSYDFTGYDSITSDSEIFNYAGEVTAQNDNNSDLTSFSNFDGRVDVLELTQNATVTTSQADALAGNVTKNGNSLTAENSGDLSGLNLSDVDTLNMTSATTLPSSNLPGAINANSDSGGPYAITLQDGTDISALQR